jgi:DNA-binding beta-propeller fold protein YncE
MRRSIVALAALGPVTLITASWAKMMLDPADFGPPGFALTGAPIAGGKAAATPAHLTSSPIAALDDGALVIDPDSGALVRTGRDGAAVASLAIGAGAGLLAYDPVARRAFVADRRGDRIVVVEVAAAHATLAATASWPTPVEPYGVALSPDRTTVLITTIADRALVAYDATTGAERWRAALPAEPRGLAISPDGRRALVASLAVGDVTSIELVGAHRVAGRALPTTRGARPCRRCAAPAASFARGAFAVTFLGDGEAVVPFQREVPVQARDGGERQGSYGGGFDAPITHHLAFLGFGDHPTEAVAEISDHQPHALAYDGARDQLYVVGLGSDSVLQLRDAATAKIALGGQASLAPADGDLGKRCGPDGVAVAGDGTVLVWCAFSRSVTRVRFTPAGPAGAAGAADATVEIVARGPALAPSRLDPPAQLGRVLFHASTFTVSQRGGLACASCHPDGRADGLSWRIDKKELQTPLLAGRVVGTHPFKWDGTDPDLPASLTSTMKRLGGTGLDASQTAALVAFLEAQPAVRTPTRDPAAVARGQQAFDAAGCRSCHDGPAYTDQERHAFAGTLAHSDTPSLLGLAASAPYYHDGSAPTLAAVLRDRGAVHGMADGKALTPTQLADLTAFLETR